MNTNNNNDFMNEHDKVPLSIESRKVLARLSITYIVL